MTAIKTTAIVEDAEHLRLDEKIATLKKGEQIELLIIARTSPAQKNWQQILKNIGVYDKQELVDFVESRGEPNYGFEKLDQNIAFGKGRKK